MLTSKVLQGIAPEYLEPVVRVADLPGRQALHSAITNLSGGATLQTVDNRQWSIPVAGPQLWNSLLEDITSAPSLFTFRKR